MNKKLTRHGNSLALIIDKPILDLLHINDKTTLSLRIENGELIISNKATKTHKQSDIDEIADRVMDKYESVFKKLAK